MASTNRMRKDTNKIFAIEAATAMMPPKPRIAATTVMVRNATPNPTH